MDKKFEFETAVIFTRVWPVSAWGALTPPRQTQTILRKLKREPSNNTSNFLSIIAHGLSQVEAAKIHAKERIKISKNTPPVESLIFFGGKCKNKVKVENCMYFFLNGEESPVSGAAIKHNHNIQDYCLRNAQLLIFIVYFKETNWLPLGIGYNAERCVAQERVVKYKATKKEKPTF